MRGICSDCQNMDQIVCGECRSDKRCADCGRVHYEDSEFCSLCRSKHKLCVSCRRHNALSGSKFCSDCTPECLGCHKLFDPKFKSNVFCRSCEDKMDDLRCVSCGNLDYNLNSRGLCHDCAGTKYEMIDVIPEYVCIVCQAVRVEVDLGLCESCKSDTDECPSCGNIKRKYQYQCNSCERK